MYTVRIIEKYRYSEDMLIRMGTPTNFFNGFERGSEMRRVLLILGDLHECLL